MNLGMVLSAQHPQMTSAINYASCDNNSCDECFLSHHRRSALRPFYDNSDDLSVLCGKA